MADETQMQTAAAPFQRMSDRILHNKDESFGGAFVVVAPGEAPIVIQSLFLNDGATPGMFWAALKTIVEQQLMQVDAQERQLQAGFGRR